MLYETFMPNYYSTLVKNQQQVIMLDNLYFYIADGVTQDAVGNDNPKCPRDEQKTLNQIMYGGKLSPSNTIAMVKRIPWVDGKVYAKYDSTDPDLSAKDFYCVNSLGYVYKCIDNNKGGPSTQEPTTNVPGTFQLSDGYIWHYMFKVTEKQLSDFKVQDMMPMFVDPNVTASAVRGTVSTIEVKNSGTYLETTSGMIQQVISNNTIRLSDTASPLSGTYNQMGMYITMGDGQGEYYQITNYNANTSGRFAQLNKNLQSAGLGSYYDIVPFVRIIGNGQNASARAVMAGNQVDRIQILNRGSEYTLAQATLIANTVYSTPGVLDVNLSPSKGHGGDIYQELYVDYLLINIDFDSFIIDNNPPINEISFCKVGMIRGLLDEQTMTLYSEPTFNNMFTAHVPPTFGSFGVGDIVFPTITGAPTAEVVYANNTHIVGVYHTPFLRFQEGNTLQNANGINGVILDIIQPQIKLIVTDVVTITNTDTIRRDENSRETLQMLVKVK